MDSQAHTKHILFLEKEKMFLLHYYWDTRYSCFDILIFETHYTVWISILLRHTSCFIIYIIGTHYLFQFLYYWDTLPVWNSILLGHSSDSTCFNIYIIGTHYLFQYLYYWDTVVPVPVSISILLRHSSASTCFNIYIIGTQ